MGGNDESKSHDSVHPTIICNHTFHTCKTAGKEYHADAKNATATGGGCIVERVAKKTLEHTERKTTEKDENCREHSNDTSDDNYTSTTYGDGCDTFSSIEEGTRSI